MANLFKRPTSQFWFACYRNRHGQQIRKSTKSTDKTAALKMALEWEGVENLAKHGTAALSQFQQVVNQVAKDVIGQSLPSKSIEVYLQEWLEGAQRRNAATTVERYRHVVNGFLKSLGPAAKQSVRGVSPIHVERFLNGRLDQGVAPKTAAIDLKILSVAFRRAEKFGDLDRNPVPAVGIPKIVSSEREPFTLPEVEKLVAATGDLDWQTAILLGAYTGARLGDCVAMTWDHVDAESGFLRYSQKKTGKMVAVPIHRRLVSHLHHLSEQHVLGYLCPSLASKTPGGKRGLSEVFKRIVKRAGIDPMIVQGKGKQKFTKRTFHSLRHGFISALANSGVSEEVRMKLTGHASSDIHKKYTHLSTEPLQQAIDGLN